MHPAQNPSPRAVLSAVKNKPLPIFRVDSTAPKLLLCIPLTQEDPTAQKGGMPAGLFSPGAPSVQSLKVYDTDLPAFTFFKQKLKRVTEEELLSHILSSASASAYGSRRSATANGAIEAQRLLFQTRLSRVEFAQTLRELLQEGPVSNNNIPEAWSNSSQDDALSSPPPNAANVGGGGMQQLQTYTVNLFRMFDHEGRGSVLVVEVLLALSLFLNLTPEDKLRFAFSVLDVSNSGELSPLQLQPLYRAIYSMLSGLCSTHFRMSVPSHPGSPAANTQPTGSNGPLSPSSLHSLPHEQLQKRLESTSQFQSGELFRLANPSRNGKLSLAQFIEVTQRHKHLFSFMHALDLDKVFSPRHADSASEIKHSQSKFEQDLAEASNTKRPFTAPSVNASQGSKSQPMGSPTSSTVDFASAFDSAKTSTRPTTAPASKSSGGSAVVPELLFTIPLAVEGSSTPSVQLRFTTASLQTLVILYSKAGFNKLSVKDFHNIFSSRCSNPAHMLTLKQYREILSTTCFAPSELTRLSPGEVQFLRVALDSIFLTISASPDVDRPVDFESLAIALGSISGVEIKQRKIEVAFKILTGTLNDNAAAQLKTMSRTELFRAIRAVLAVLLTLTSPALSYERAKEQRSVIEHSHCEVNGKLASHNAFLKVDHCFNIIHGADAFDRTDMTFPAFESLLQQGELVQADEDNQRTPMEAIGLVPYFSLWDLIDTL